MPYTQPDNVRRLIQTELGDADLTAFIEESDAEVDRLITVENTADPLIRKLSTLLTAKTILARDPASFTIGEYSETTTAADIDAEATAITRLLRRPSIKATPDTPTEPRRLTA